MHTSVFIHIAYVTRRKKLQTGAEEIIILRVKLYPRPYGVHHVNLRWIAGRNITHISTAALTDNNSYNHTLHLFSRMLENVSPARLFSLCFATELFENLILKQRLDALHRTDL